MNPMNYYASTMASMGQDVFNAPSVFNYYCARIRRERHRRAFWSRISNR